MNNINFPTSLQSTYNNASIPSKVALLVTFVALGLIGIGIGLGMHYGLIPKWNAHLVIPLSYAMGGTTLLVTLTVFILLQRKKHQQATDIDNSLKEGDSQGEVDVNHLLSEEAIQQVSKEIEMLADCVHFDLFPKETRDNFYIKSREDMITFIDKNGARSSSKENETFSVKPWQTAYNWKLDKDLRKGDAQVFSLADGKFQFSQEELTQQMDSLAVGFDSKNGLDAGTLQKMLSRGYHSGIKEQNDLAPFRMVSSEVFFVRDALGHPVERKSGASYTPSVMMTTNAPENNEDVDQETYWNTMEILLVNTFKEAKRRKVQFLILNGIGMGSHLYGDKAQNYERFAAVLKKVASKYQGAFEGIIFADPNAALTKAVADQLQNASCSFKGRVITTCKSMIDVAIYCSKKEYRAAVLNPGDPSCIAGQYWEKGHVALEEMIALCSTMLFSQHPRINSLVTDQSHYFDLSKQ